MAGWQLVKCTSTYFVSPFWGGVGRSIIDTIKKCIYGGLVHFAGRGVGKYLHNYYLLMHVAFFFAIVRQAFGKRKRWRDRFNLALANQQSIFYFASYFASVLSPSS